MDTPASRACGIHAARLNLADYAVNFSDAHPVSYTHLRAHET